MTWNYRILEDDDREGTLAVHEVHYDEQGEPTLATMSAVFPVGDDMVELVASLGLFLQAFGKPVLKMSSFPAAPAPEPRSQGFISMSEFDDLPTADAAPAPEPLPPKSEDPATTGAAGSKDGTTDDAAFWAAHPHPRWGSPEVMYADAYKRDVEAADLARDTLQRMYNLACEGRDAANARADEAESDMRHAMSQRDAAEARVAELERRIVAHMSDQLDLVAQLQEAKESISELESGKASLVQANVSCWLSLKALEERIRRAVEKLEATRWPTEAREMSQWFSTAEGKNWKLVTGALDVLRD